ncbi:hypothetical protein BDA96_04G009700 [Sorghum bicolor]|uniref:Knottin scorpion toxin-like domain-containing protein n=2 Tax=Sorghum bicolor TaxID=4558 RepID=A0A921QZR7_SORBI|nr:hypothetical protein BDA96_04G009700 [Sorghum bicolor]OQU84197.1 hypothetical protein SORBI_3004G008700 [Sorghum bicolor]
MMKKMGSARKIMLMLLLLVVLIASHEAARIGVGTETELFSCGDDNNPEIKCLYRCIIRPGLCNKCCKKSGFVSGKCVGGGCYCCTAPLDK